MLTTDACDIRRFRERKYGSLRLQARLASESQADSNATADYTNALDFCCVLTKDLVG